MHRMMNVVKNILKIVYAYKSPWLEPISFAGPH